MGCVYIEPNSKTELTLNSDDLSSLEYKGDLASPDDFLKKTSLLNQSVNDSFFKQENMMQLLRKDEASFLMIIDSLKKVYLNPLSSIQEEKGKLSKDFIKIFTANVNFKVDNLIVHYPDWHAQVTGEEVILSKAALDRINSKTIDNIALLDLPSYKEFCKTWIDYNADVLAIKNTDPKNYCLKRMDAIFGYLPEIFTNHVLLDYWISEYLSEFIQNNGMTNSEKYVNDFYASCKTEIYGGKVKELCNYKR